MHTRATNRCAHDRRDIGFLRFRGATIAGKTVEIGRIGTSGNLAFEVRGPLAEGPEVYDALYRAGQDLGLEASVGAAISSTMSRAASRRRTERSAVPRARTRAIASLSRSSASGLRLRRRVAWTRPIRARVTERRPGEEYKTIDLPTSPPWSVGMLRHADHVLKGGRAVGASSGTIYSYYFREVLPMGTVDVAAAKEGTEVVVQWGDHRKRIQNVRATVGRYPYLTEGRNDQVDTRSLR